MEGKNVELYPDIAERIVKEGHLIGNHTFSHINVNDSSSQEIENQIVKTNDIIYKITGVKPYYFRTPYNVNASKINENDIRTLSIVKKLGMKTAESNSDGFNYASITKGQITPNVTTDPKDQVLLQGGDSRSTTINAIPQIITTLQNKGQRFVTLEEIDGLNNVDGVDPETYLAAKTQLPLPVYKYLNSGRVDLTPNEAALKNSQNILGFMTVSITVLGIFRLISLIIGLLLSYVLDKKRKRGAFTPPVTVIVPSYNEEKVVCNTVQSLVDSDYPDLEILVADDGSKDNSYKILCERFGNIPNIRIVTKENGGKASALNYGIAMARHDFIVCMDADTLFARDAIKILMRQLCNPKVGEVAGNVQIGNDYFAMKANNKSLNFFKYFNWLTTFQRIEYINGQNFDKEAYNSGNSVLVVPGAIGVWRKEAIIRAGGYKTDTLAEDTNLTLDIIRAGYEVRYEKDALCFTEAPETWQQLWKQRIRWQFGTMQVVYKNLDLLFNPKYGSIGFYALPQTAFNLFNLFISPISNIYLTVLVIKLILSNWYSPFRYSGQELGTLRDIALISLFFFAVDVLITVFSLWRDRSKNKFILMWFLPFTNIVFKSFIFAVTVAALIKVFKGEIVGWGHLVRTGSVQMQKSETKL